MHHSGELMVHGLETISAINREAASKHILQRHEEAYVNHHKACYGQEKLTFEWQSPEHPGVWAWGGPHGDAPPVFLGVKWVVPSGTVSLGWWCYLGPRPEFTNEAR